MNNILCKCQEHKAIQQYLHSSYDPDLGKKKSCIVQTKYKAK